MERVLTSQRRQSHGEEFDTEMEETERMQEEGLPDDYQQLEQGQQSVDRPTSTEEKIRRSTGVSRIVGCCRWKRIGNLS